MREFARLYDQLDSTTKTNAKVEAIAEHFRTVRPEDAAWSVFLLTGRKIKSLVNRTKLRDWATELAGLPDWLFAECYEAVGDLAETIAKVLPEPPVERTEDEGLNFWIQNRLLPLGAMDDRDQRWALVEAWEELDSTSRFVWNKLLTGGFRVGVSQDLVIRGLAAASGVPVAAVAHRLMGTWSPSADFFRQLVSEEAGDAHLSRPYPFCLAHALDPVGPEVLGDPVDWFAEWKWDGIRAQLIRRSGESFLWSRGEELIHETFPEVVQIGESLPDGCVIDGECLAWNQEAPMAFQSLQRRLGRKGPSKKLMAEVPAALVAFDILEWEGEDVRGLPLAQRRKILEEVVINAANVNLRISPRLDFENWQDLAKTRESSLEHRAEGIMLKKKDSPYEVGRKKGNWWKWKIAPLTVDAVLIYAQRGSGKRASLYTDYTFGVWNAEGALIPFAKAYSGLTDEEIRKVDNFIRLNTAEKFGPVRTVKPQLVFELAFEGIQRSTRHKSGVATRFPRILRWRTDKKPEDADTLDRVFELLNERNGPDS